ncbi:YARHG domain-containing protein [Methyloceanibacter superfactus]|uniref:YARHG domain-containing protein n=1 Tax=Methyloceanibacter superfactus TaxID=1774969 RepID=UPI0009F61744
MLLWRHCQTHLSGPAKGAGLRRSGRQLTPLGQAAEGFCLKMLWRLRLWSVQRNSIYKSHGYSFKTAKAINYFRQCWLCLQQCSQHSNVPR